MPAPAGMISRAAAWQFPVMITALYTLSLNAAGADGNANGVPEWLHLLPAGTFSGVDGRGPYVNDAPDQVVSLFATEGRKLPIDENHSIDLEGPKGRPTPARGWITALQSRADGIWGQVEWTPEGRTIMAGKAYGFLSPAFLHTAAKPFKVARLMRVSLTNDPNLSHLKSLHNREDTAMLAELRKAFGLPDTADEAAVLAAVAAQQQVQTALMGRITTALGVAADATGDALVTALQAAIAKPVSTGDAAQEIAELKGQVKALHNQLTGYVSVTSKDKAEAVIGQAIKDGKVIPVMKDHYIARHMKDPAEVEKEISLLPSLHAGGLAGRQLPKSEDGTQLTEEDRQVMAMMGVDEKAYVETQKALYGKAVV